MITILPNAYADSGGQLAVLNDYYVFRKVLDWTTEKGLVGAKIQFF